MIVELNVSWADMWTLGIAVATLIVMIFYTFFTYRIAYEKKSPLVSFNLFDIGDSIGHIGFKMVNRSQIDSEVWCKVRTEVGGEIFSDNGFYGDKSPWILQALTQGEGHFKLENLENSKGIKLSEASKNKGISSIRLSIQIRYGIIGGKRWEKSSLLKYVYDFNSEKFWLDV